MFRLRNKEISIKQHEQLTGMELGPLCRGCQWICGDYQKGAVGECTRKIKRTWEFYETLGVLHWFL